jgi:hypothetical protein
MALKLLEEEGAHGYTDRAAMRGEGSRGVDAVDVPAVPDEPAVFPRSALGTLGSSSEAKHQTALGNDEVLQG